MKEIIEDGIFIIRETDRNTYRESVRMNNEIKGALNEVRRTNQDLLHSKESIAKRMEIFQHFCNIQNEQEKLEKAGLTFSGMSPDGRLPEIVEIKDHPFFIGVQFHPELKSKPFAAHPLFVSFVASAIKHQNA
jgi:CTP synthase (UTP-ammonia lyase)